MEPAIQPEEIFIEAALLAHPPESTEYWPHTVEWKKQYEIWRHGNDLIASAKSHRDLEVAVMQLHRAVEQRDTILEQLYKFRDIPWFPKGLSQYSVMTELGIIRPSLKDPLRQLRNEIAHAVDDVDLDRKQCDYLSDTAWYYLRATDIPARQCAAELSFTCGEDDAHFTMLALKFTPGSWSINVEGNIPDRHLVDKRASDALSVKVSSSSLEEYRGVRHLHFVGVVTGSEPVCRKLVAAFFEEGI